MNTFTRPLKGYPDYYIQLESEAEELSSDFSIYTTTITRKKSAYLVNTITGEFNHLYKFAAFSSPDWDDIEEEAICLIEDRVFTRYLALKMK